MQNTGLTEKHACITESSLRESRIFQKSDFDYFIPDGIFNQLNYS
jgi:hypothetical protein